MKLDQTCSPLNHLIKPTDSEIVQFGVKKSRRERIPIEVV